MSISAQDVKALREKTGAGMMDCKKALLESGGDFEKAIDYLREKGLSKAAKRVGKSADDGIISFYLSEDRMIGVLAEVNSETDFVARTDEFQNFSVKLCEAIAAGDPTPDGWQELKIDGTKAGDLLDGISGKMGEKMEVRRFQRFETTNGLIDIYIHAGARLGVMLEVDAEGDRTKASEIAHELAMQIAAASPTAVTRDEVSTEEIEREMEIYRAQARNEGKPEQVIDRIAEGKLNKFYSDVCLIEQPYIKDPKVKVSDFLAGVAKESGIKISPKRFVKFILGGN